MKRPREEKAGPAWGQMLLPLSGGPEDGLTKNARARGIFAILTVA